MGVFRSQSPRALFFIPGWFYMCWWLIFSDWRIRHFYWCPFPGCFSFLLCFQSFFAPVHTFLFTFRPDFCEQKPVNRAQNILKVIFNQMVFPCSHPLSWILPHLFSIESVSMTSAFRLPHQICDCHVSSSRWSHCPSDHQFLLTATLKQSPLGYFTSPLPMGPSSSCLIVLGHCQLPI